MPPTVCRKCGGPLTRKRAGQTYHSKKLGKRVYFDYRCHRCEALRQRERRKKPDYAFKAARSIAKRRGLRWELTEEQYFSLRRLPCHYCGFPLPEGGMGIDRISYKRGYFIKNCVPCCTECNVTKNSHFSYGEMKMFLGPAIAALKRARRKRGEEDHRHGRKIKY